MNNQTTKNKLLKSLKIASIAGAVVMCSTIVSGATKTSANPFSRIFRSASKSFTNFRNGFRNSHMTSNLKLNPIRLKNNGSKLNLQNSTNLTPTAPPLSEIFTPRYNEGPNGTIKPSAPPIE